MPTRVGRGVGTSTYTPPHAANCRSLSARADRLRRARCVGRARCSCNVHYRPFFNGFGGFSAGSAERGHRGEMQPTIEMQTSLLGRRWAGRAQGGWRGGGMFFITFHRVAPSLAIEFRLRATIRITPRVRSRRANDTDELRE
eukprot:gene13551-biopygen18564